MALAEGVAAVLTLELFGGFALRRAEGGLIALPRKAQALLGYLALAGNREVARERIAGMLWEDSPEAQARTSLRQALASLRRACPPDGLLVVKAAALALDPAAVQVDVRTFEILAAGDRAQRLAAASLYRGDLMEGLDGIGNGWSAWLAAELAGRELRQIAVLNIGLADPDGIVGGSDVEAAHARLSERHGLVTRVVDAAGGQVHDRMGDVVVALFGVSQARLDDPALAASAALAVHRALAGMVPPMRARAAVTAGTVLLAPAFGEAAAIGKAVTTAGLLRAAAGAGETLAPAALAAELSPRLVTRALGAGRIAIAARGTRTPGRPRPCPSSAATASWRSSARCSRRSGRGGG